MPSLEARRLFVLQDRIDVVKWEHVTSLKTAPRPAVHIQLDVLRASVVEQGTASSENSYVAHVGLAIQVGGAERARILSSNQSCFYRVIIGKGVLRCTLWAIL